MSDTRPEADAMRRAILLRRSPLERMQEALRMSDELREVALKAFVERLEALGLDVSRDAESPSAVAAWPSPPRLDAPETPR